MSMDIDNGRRELGIGMVLRKVPIMLKPIFQSGKASTKTGILDLSHHCIF
jgi:hypothetical protein